MVKKTVTGNEGQDEGFLARWSARKSLAAEGKSLADRPMPNDQSTIAENAQAESDEPELTDEELLRKYDLPDPETINEESGLDRFLSGEMPERLRQMALRRLWRLNPFFGNVCEMVEYGEDYTDAATVIEGMQTAYTAGKGYLKQILEPEKDDDSISELSAETELTKDLDAESEEQVIEKANEEPRSEHRETADQEKIEDAETGTATNESTSKTQTLTEFTVKTELSSAFMPENGLSKAFFDVPEKQIVGVQEQQNEPSKGSIEEEIKDLKKRPARMNFIKRVQ